MSEKLVNVVSKSGQGGTMPASAAEKAIASGAFRLETPEETAARAEALQVREAQASASNKGALAAIGLAGARGAFDAATAPVRIANRAGEALTGVNVGDKAVQGIDRLTGGTGAGQTFDEATSGAAVLSGLSGLATGALSDKTVEQGFREANEAQRATALANRGETMLGNVGGQVAGMLASGGAGALANLGKGATAALAARGAGQVAARAGGLATAGVVEGALQGAAQANEDAFIENKALTAEQFWGTVGLNAALSGAFAGGLGAVIGKFEKHAAGKLAIGATKSAEEAELDRMASRALGGEPPAPGVGKALRELYEAAASTASGVEREAIEKYGPHRVLAGDKEAIGAWKELAERPQLVEKAARDLTEGVDALRRESQAIMDEVVDAGLKREVVAKNLSGVDHRVALKGAREQAVTIKQALGALEDVETFGDNRWARGALKYADDQLNDVLSGALGAEDSYMALDAAKRQLQRLKVRGENGISGATFDMNKKGALQEFTRLMDETAEAARVHLEDVSLWGKQGEAQAATNAAWARLLQSKRVADKALLTNYVDNYGRPVYEADPAKIEAFAAGLGTARASKVEALVKDNLEATRDLIDTIAANYDVGTKHAASLSAARAAQEKVATTLAETSVKTRRVNQLTAMLEAEKDGVGGLIGNGTITGGILGGFGGAALGAASNVITRPMATAMQSARIMALAGNAVKRTTKALDKFFGHAPSSAGIGKAAGAIARTLPAAGRRAATASVSEPLLAEGPKMRENVAALAANPVAMADQLDRYIGNAADRLPQTHMALAAVPMRAIQFLASKLPPAPPPNALDGAMRAPIAQSDQDRFNEFVKGATDPLSALEDMSRGLLTLDRVEAIQAVYPQLYEKLRESVFDYVAAAAEAKQPLAYNKRAQLDILFGGKGAIEPTMTTQYMRTVEAASQAMASRDQAKRAQSKAARAPNFAAAAKSPLDRIGM